MPGLRLRDGTVIPVDKAPTTKAEADAIIADYNSYKPSPLVEDILKREGGFQKGKEDKGNYNSKGELVGTNYGISAPFLEARIGRPPTEEDVKTLDKNQAAKWHQEVLDNNNISSYPENSQLFISNMLTMTSGKGVNLVLDRAKKNNKTDDPTPEQIWVEYKKYLQSLRSWPIHGKGWTNRYEDLLKVSK